MNKLLLLPVSLVFSANAFATVYNITGQYAVYDPSNALIPGSEAGVSGTYDDVTQVMGLASLTDFLGFNWTADGNIITTPGSYDIDTIQGGSITGIQLASGQWLGQLLYDWSVNLDIDIVHVWNVTSNPDGSIDLVSTDVISDLFPTGSGAPGHPTIDGPTVGFSYTLDLHLEPVPVPAAAWLFGSGLLGLVGVARRKARG